jgi:hypothetical protein
MKRSVAWLFFVAAAGSLVAGLVPLLRDRPVNVVFLSSAVLWLVLGVAAKRNARGVGPGESGPAS